MEKLDAIKVTYPLSDFGCQDYPPIEGKGYEITKDELDKLSKHELKWSVGASGKSILVPNDPTEENKQNGYRKRIAELKKLLAESDYKAIKYAEGTISESEYMLTKAQRQAWRDEINTLEGMLK